MSSFLLFFLVYINRHEKKLKIYFVLLLQTIKYFIMNELKSRTNKEVANSMMHYWGQKEILATEMTREEYNDYRGWKTPENENPDDAGYLVEYLNSPDSEIHSNHKNYISWSPKKVFENSYSSNGRHSFSAALNALKNGKRVCRDGWNGVGMFVCKQIDQKIRIDVVPNMTSMSKNVKEELVRRNYNADDIVGVSLESLNEISFKNQFLIIDRQNNISSWVPSSNDLCANDWVILDF